MSSVIFSREWAMPNRDTFSIKPIKKFIEKYDSTDLITVDPFARNSSASYTNDLNPNMNTDYHMEACDFLKLMHSQKVEADLGFFDPPYSPRQITECYSGVGKKATTQDTQSSFYTKAKDALDLIMKPGGVVLSFCWNSNGMGKGRGYEIMEILIVAHGGWHNDTICIAERKVKP